MARRRFSSASLGSPFLAVRVAELGRTNRCKGKVFQISHRQGVGEEGCICGRGGIMKSAKWSTSPLGELVMMKSGGTPSRDNPTYWNGDIPWFSGKDLRLPYLSNSIEHITLKALGHGTRLSPAGTLLVLVRGMTLMKEVPVGILLREAAFNQDVKALLPHDKSLDSRYLAYFLMADNARIRNLVTTAGHGTGRLPIEALEEYPVPLPPLPEQRKIAAILSTWDEALEKLDALIAAKDRRKQALMQKLLAGKFRQASYTSWMPVKLFEVAEEQGERNKSMLDRSRLFAVTKAEGMVPMRERVQGASIHRCKIVEKGWFAYNPMRINIGSIARWEGSAPAMVSADYVVFRTDEKRLLSNYLHYVRQSAAWAGFVGASGNGSVRIRIWFEDLGRFKFYLPTLNEQRAIINVLEACDEELHLLRAKHAALDQQKCGLMQRLLTGAIRVRLEKT